MNIRDIADMSGVSVATVSRVINNSPSVSEQTREKVLAVMQREDFVPNAFAGGIGRNAMKIVGILCADVSSLYYSKAVSLLEEGLRRNGYDSLLCCTGYELEDKRAYLALLAQKRVDAIILVGSAYREERDNTHIRETASQVPVFVVNSHVQIPNVFCVYCDEHEAMRNNVQYLAAKGCRDILYLHDMKKWAWAGSQKLAGFRDGLAECGIAETPDTVQVVNKSSMADAQKRVSELLTRGVSVSGILASEDLLAIGAQKAVLEQKLEVPIIGFNNSEYVLCCTPALSSSDNMLGVICPMIVDMMTRFFDGEKISSKVVVSATLAER
ncbi:LacI family transcriptional regulator [Clostridia bacterium]|nr:LacI family transcriptional regulator [Clostridia bacterium]